MTSVLEKDKHKFHVYNLQSLEQHGQTRDGNDHT